MKKLILLLILALLLVACQEESIQPLKHSNPVWAQNPYNKGVIK